MFGLGPRTALTPEGGTRVVVLLVLDGFGYEQWQCYAEFEFFRRMDAVRSITSCFPSTTSANVTALHTGLTPAEHGLPEWWVWFEELGRVITPLPFANVDGSPVQADPSILYSGPTIYDTLARGGVESFVLIRKAYVGSPYSSRINRGATPIGFADVDDMVRKLNRLVAEAAGPRYIHCYWETIDHVGHEFGPHSPAHVEQIKNFSQAVSRGLPKDALLLVTADHGQVCVDPNKTLYLNEHREVTENLEAPPWGAPRDVFLQVRNVDRVAAYLRRLLGDRAEVVKVDDTLHLFGRGTPRPRSRFGNLLVLPRDNHTVWYEHLPGKKFRLRGVHGGMTAAEMLVPFAVCRL